jgi:multidrug resistance efflux pump
LTELRKLEFTYHKSVAQVKQAKSEKNIAGLTANAKKAQYDAASIELDLREIRSPFKGQVVEVMKHVGDWVTAGEPIMHIVGLDRVRVKGYVLVSGPTGASHDEVLGKPVTITVYSSGDKQHTVKGIIGFASPVIEGLGSNRQFRIWAEVDNEKTIDPVTKQEAWKIQPGSVASMTIDLTPKSSASARSESVKSDKGKQQSFKPVTGEAEKSDAKATKSLPRER